MMSLNRKEKNYKIICNLCKIERFVTYTQNWNINVGNSSGDCIKCVPKNTSGLKLGSGWNKGITGKNSHSYGHPSYFPVGYVVHNKGKRHTEEHKLKLRLAKLGKTGKSANNWQGGKTSLNMSIRTSNFYAEWRMNILRRDNFICQHCKKRGGKLHVDHIKPFSLIVVENKIRTVDEALKCNDLWDEKNGRTLCFDCHKKTDTYLSKIYSRAT